MNKPADDDDFQPYDDLGDGPISVPGSGAAGNGRITSSLRHAFEQRKERFVTRRHRELVERFFSFLGDGK
jgi:hypothetical protein